MNVIYSQIGDLLRWFVTRHERASFGQATMELAEMHCDTDNIHKSLSPARIKSSNECVLKLMDSFNQFTNPFAIGERQDNVFCLTSGQVATDKVSSDLLSYIDSGEAAAVDFITSRLFNKSIQFHETLKRLNLSTFKSMSVI